MVREHFEPGFLATPSRSRTDVNQTLAFSLAKVSLPFMTRLAAPRPKEPAHRACIVSHNEYSTGFRPLRLSFDPNKFALVGYIGVREVDLISVLATPNLFQASFVSGIRSTGHKNSGVPCQKIPGRALYPRRGGANPVPRRGFRAY